MTKKRVTRWYVEPRYADTNESAMRDLAMWCGATDDKIHYRKMDNKGKEHDVVEVDHPFVAKMERNAVKFSQVFRVFTQTEGESAMNLWPMVASRALGLFTVLFGAIFLFELCVAIKLEFVKLGTNTAMVIGSMMWFIVLASFVFAHTAKGRAIEKPNNFLSVELFGICLFAVSLTGMFVGGFKTPALIANAIIALIFFGVTARLCLEERGICTRVFISVKKEG